MITRPGIPRLRPGDEAPLLVVGDALLDLDLTGRVSRLAPGEPAPVVEQVQEQARPGGAALAAHLAAATGRRVVLATALARDEAAARLQAALGAAVELVVLPVERPTTVKTRVRVGGRTLVRIDRGGGRDHPEPLAQDALAAVAGPLARAGAVLVSDYGLGLTRDEGLRALLSSARVPLVWDPHPRGGRPIPGCTLVTPNATEAEAMSGIVGSSAAAGVDQAAALARRWDGTVAVTLGERGAVLAGPAGHPRVVPLDGAAVVGDTCGAGDAFASSAAAALADGWELLEAVRVGVRASSAFLRSGGVAALASADGVRDVDPGIAASGGWEGARDADPGGAPSRTPGGSALERAVALAADVRAQGGTVVMAGGCFDLLHAGHVEYLAAARALGDCLIVALNSDSSVRALKGHGRPVVPQDDRARVLAALGSVDAVVVFEEPTPARVITAVMPDLFTKGGDYAHAFIPEQEVVAAHGGRVAILPSLPGRSSTRLLESARSLSRPVPQEVPCPPAQSASVAS